MIADNIARAETLRSARRRLALAVAALAGSVLGFCAEPSTGTRDRLQFNRDIRPILSDTCSACHGPDKNQRKAKLRLDVRENAIEKGAIVPGKPDESELVARIFATDEDDLMPPADSHKTLTPEQKEKLRRWITEGAEYQPHWAYIKPRKPETPRIHDREWVQNAIDAFILHDLEARRIGPSQEADRRTLLRRLSLDLIGLPPTPAELKAFVADAGSQAYERQVDRLLESPHFGERMAVPWLDLVRFADTVGYHGDQNANIFPYRDYVINSFNRNKPFDRFTIEQLAGDLLSNPTAEQRVATGFNRLNMMTREGGAQPKEYLAKYAADRVRTVSTTWLGSTMGCAECHDHKYDPFTTKDFYSLAAFFADVRQWGVYNDYNYTPNPDLRGWSNDHPFPPEIEVDSFALHLRQARLQQRIDGLIETAFKKLESEAAHEAAFKEWRQESISFLKRWPDGWATPDPSVTLQSKDTNAAAESSFAVQEDRSILFLGKPAEQNRIRLPLATGWVSAIRFELLPHEAHDGNILRGGGGATFLAPSAALMRQGKEREEKLSFHHAEADRKEERYANGHAIIGVKDAWRFSTEYKKSKQTAVWLLDKPLRVADGDALLISCGTSAMGCVRVSFTPFAAQDPLKSGRGAGLAKAMRKTPGPRDDLVKAAYFLGTGWDAEAFGRFKTLHGDLLECRNGRSPTLVTEAWEPVVTRVLPRGNWQDESGEIVQPFPPHFLPQVSTAEGHRLTRLDLAKWLVSPENPLTARTIMNRIWKQFFGTGISGVVDDLGLQGDPPSHPELLDWLAVEFMESGWNLKHMVKLIVMSSAYRQESSLRPELKDVDPLNRLLASQNPRRLDAEFVRDTALFVAGLINLDVGGPSAFPYQPPGYYVNLQFPDRDYYPNKDGRQYRRGVYAHWQRTFLQPMMANFDAPSREECIAYRIVSNTPQQALTLLNDPTFVEASRVFAARLLSANAGSDEERLNLAFTEALARSIKPKEEVSLSRFLAIQRDHYKSNQDEADKLLRVGIAPWPKDVDKLELATWTQVCRVILNLHETITRY
ncbi:MAG TPA: PSD1 and planctomycete cytochrome C domain-containing protein [Verrucomicrobiae bacterium]|nr:PSD1 and planctomycete cytochrome C domain-containing protein [Verrucomicrobiae bacterium]